MNIQFALGLVFVAASSFSAARPAPDNLSFHVKSGTSLARGFESRQEISQDEAEILMNGQPFPSGNGGGMTAIQSQVLDINDEFVAVEGAAPQKLRRTFSKIESSGEQTTKDPMDSGEKTDTRRGKSELEGKTVVFDWDASKAEFLKSFDPEGPEAALLAGLTEDLDFRAFLPAKGLASEDDSWGVELAAIKSVFMPGGNLSLKPVDPPQGEDEDSPGMGMLNEDPALAFNGLSGGARATYKGSREIDGVSCGVIALEFKVSTTKDLSDKLPKPGNGPGGGEIHIEHVNAFLSLEGEAELIWDLSGGFARSFNMSAKIKNQMEIAMKLAQGGKTMDITRKMQMSGSYALKVAVVKL